MIPSIWLNDRTILIYKIQEEKSWEEWCSLFTTSRVLIFKNSQQFTDCL